MRERTIRGGLSVPEGGDETIGSVRAELGAGCRNTAESLFRRNEVINHLATIDQLSEHVQTMVPIQVLAEIDNSRNPMQLTRERLERAATENQFMNGKIQAIKVCAVATERDGDAERVGCSRTGITITTLSFRASLS